MILLYMCLVTCTENCHCEVKTLLKAEFKGKLMFRQEKIHADFTVKVIARLLRKQTKDKPKTSTSTAALMGMKEKLWKLNDMKKG